MYSLMSWALPGQNKRDNKRDIIVIFLCDILCAEVNKSFVRQAGTTID